MLNKKMEEAFNAQIASEFYSSHLYLSMSAYSESINLPGFGHWMRLQSDEERAHALRLFEYVHDRGGRVDLREIKRPQTEFHSALEMFELALAHEKEVTQDIYRMYNQAQKADDYASETELQWFIREQVEEEKTAADIVAQLKMVGDQPTALLMMDRYLASRSLSAEPAS